MLVPSAPVPSVPARMAALVIGLLTVTAVKGSVFFAFSARIFLRGRIEIAGTDRNALSALSLSAVVVRRLLSLFFHYLLRLFGVSGDQLAEQLHQGQARVGVCGQRGDGALCGIGYREQAVGSKAG